ncbi:MAG: DUF1566 domain-containing protein [Leptothrix sp. (in: b-proteobacteria)]
MATSIATGVPDVAAKSITKVMTSQGTATPGNVVTAPGSAGSEVFVMAVDANEEPVLLGLFSGGANLSVDSTAQTLVRIALQEVTPQAGSTVASITAAITASANYPALLAAMQAQLATGQSPAASNTVMGAVWQVAADAAAIMGLQTASAAAVRRPLATSNVPSLPYYFWNNSVTNKTWLTDVASTPDFTFLNRTFLAWEVSTNGGFSTAANPLSTGGALQVLFAYYGGTESSTQITGTGMNERLTINVQQSNRSRVQNGFNLTNSIVFDGLTIALRGWGINQSDSVACATNFTKILVGSNEFSAMAANPNTATFTAYGSKIKTAAMAYQIADCRVGLTTSSATIAILRTFLNLEWRVFVDALPAAASIIKVTSLVTQMIDAQTASYSVTVCKTNGVFAPCGGFTKISADGQDLPDNATTWSCVRQNATGLLWEAHVTRQNPPYPCAYDATHTATMTCTKYTNYGDGRAYDASTVPATVGSLCGQTGWRLPTVDEATALMNDPAYAAGNGTYGLFQSTWFGTDDIAYWGWTSSPGPDPGFAWQAQFYFGDVGFASVGPISSYSAIGIVIDNVRLVR